MTAFELLDHLNQKGIALWTQDGKLRYRTPTGALDASLKAEIVKHKPELLTLLGSTAGHSSQAEIQPVSREQRLPLSSAQQRLWLLSQLDPASNAAYNIPLLLQLSGPLNIPALTDSLNTIIQRHEILRTTIHANKGQPFQKIAEAVTLDLPLVDLSQKPATEREAEARRLSADLVRLPFDLESGPLLRAKLLRLGTDEHWLILVMHHIISDAWSQGIFNRELSACYQAFSHGEAPSLPELAIQYADFAVWERAQLGAGTLEPHLAYWKKQLAGDLPLLELPTDRPRPSVKSFRGATYTFTIPLATAEAVRAISRQEKATPFMTLLAAFKALLYRYTRQADLLVGTPIANRTQAEVEPLIGFFVNTLILRSDLSNQPTFRNLLTHVRQITLAAYDHQALPFDKLVEIIQPDRTGNHNPLFQVMFALQNTPPTPLDLAGLTVNPLRIESESAKFDLALNLTETPGGLNGEFLYSADLFDAPTIERLAAHFNTLLAAAVMSPETLITHLPLLTTTEQRLLKAWNETQADYPADACIHHLFEAQVERSPEAIAIRFGETTVTYRDLNQRANQLAHHLQRLGVGPETLVGLCVERSPEMIVGLLGILKAGGAYVPLDPTYPQKRLAFIIEDTQIAVLLTQRHLLERLPDYAGRFICLDDPQNDAWQQADTNPTSTVTAENLAYTIYTSGSTGQPKGVMIEHQALVNFTEMIAATYDITAADRVLQFASISFDASAEEIYPTLTRGATLVLRTDEMLDSGDIFWRCCEAWGLTVLDLPTAYWHQLVSDLPKMERLFPKSIRLVILGGEKARTEAVNVWLEHTPSSLRTINSYGPTEATVVATLYEVTDNINGNVPIGRPIGNVQAYVLDEQMQPVPIGLPGELHLGGAGLARGYLNRPALMAERFVTMRGGTEWPSPQPSPSGRGGLASPPVGGIEGGQPALLLLYKTGDLVRYRPDGHLEFLGRLDNQIKLRGFRIELGEIEATLAQHPGIREAAVTLREDQPGHQRLVAYIVPHPSGDPTRESLNTFLKDKLPDYMVPAAFVMLENLPLTTNGKIDRHILPAPDATRVDRADDVAASDNRVEEMLIEMWQNLLGVHPIGKQDNFFQLGGHSLLAIQLVTRLREMYDIDLSLRKLFESPTIADLAPVIEEMLTTEIDA